MTKRTQREITSFQQGITIVILLIVALVVVSACRPDTDSLEIVAGEATKTELPPLATSSPQPGATMTKAMQPTTTETLATTATATEEPTPTAATEEEVVVTEVVEMTQQEQIRAEVLAAGINLDDLKNTTNNYIRNHPSVESFQQDIDQSFGSEKEDWETVVVMDIVQLQSEQEYANAPITADGWKFLVWAKTAYKKANGEWGIINIPLMAYKAETEELWVKFSENANEAWIWPDTDEAGITADAKIKNATKFIEDIFSKYGNYYLGTGAVFRFYTEYPDQNSNNGFEGKLGENPSYSEEQLKSFRLTGEADLFDYKDSNNYPYLWTFYAVNTGICKINYGN